MNNEYSLSSISLLSKTIDKRQQHIDYINKVNHEQYIGKFIDDKFNKEVKLNFKDDYQMDIK